jgi:AraC family transcriptional activator of pobA
MQAPNRSVARPAGIPIFELYGEIGSAAASGGPGFIHVETISERAGLHDWEIRPHRHQDLHQFLLVSRGGGLFSIDGEERRFTAPCLLTVAPTEPHAFAFQPDSQGYVLTVAAGFLERTLQDGGEPLPGMTSSLTAAIPEAQFAPLHEAFKALEAEFRWPRLGRGRAIASYLNLVLVSAARLTQQLRTPPGPRREGALMTRFQSLIQAHAAQGWSVADYAGALAVTPGQLTGACRRMMGRSPMQVVHDHLLIEAKRNLLYTAMTVQQIGYALGFSDPAYFSRFFTRGTGLSPKRFRQEHAG